MVFFVARSLGRRDARYALLGSDLFASPGATTAAVRVEVRMFRTVARGGTRDMRHHSTYANER